MAAARRGGGRAFVLASVAAVLLPMPLYARSLGDAEYVVWLARLCWVLVLTVGCAGLMPAAGYLSGKRRRRRSGDQPR